MWTMNCVLFKLVDLQICEMENINSIAYTLYIDFHTIFPNECYITTNSSGRNGSNTSSSHCTVP